MTHVGRSARRSRRALVLIVVLMVGVLSVAEQQPEQKASAADVVSIIGTGASWKYKSDGTDQGVQWRLQGVAAPTAWSSGSAPLGWGTTVTTTLATHPVTSYFVRDVTVDLTNIRLLKLRLRRDDGAVVYFNGAPVARSFMPYGEPGPTTLASQSVSATDAANYSEYLLPRDLLVQGANRVAVEIHQAVTNDVDGVFDLSLTGLDNSGDTLVPSQPAATATPLPTAIRLSWGAEPADVIAHRVRRGSQTVAIVPVRTSTYLDQRLAPGAAMAYSVSSIDVGGNESSAKVVSATVPSGGAPSARFDAVGDLGFGTATQLILPMIQANNTGLFVALGDFSYGGPGSETRWCTFVRNRIPSMPIALVPGNHEQDGAPDGFVDNFSACIGNKPTYTGNYARQYVVPVSNLARVIVISPSIPINGITQRYAPGSPDRQWLVDQIAAARAQVPWVVVAMHKLCVSVGSKPCEIDYDLQEVLSTADLVLTGHDHIYSRGHQLGVGAGCPKVIVVPVTPACIRDDGFDGQYTAGKGSVQVTVGVGGESNNTLNLTGSYWPLTAVANGANSWSVTEGFLTTTFTSTSLHGRFRNARGQFADEFTISKP